MKLSKRNILFLIKEACDLAAAPHEPEEGEMEMDLASLIMPGDEMAAEEMPLMDPSLDVGGAPVPEDYDAVMRLLDTNAWVVNLAIEQVMEMSGAQCQRSTVMAIIDFLKGLLGVDYAMGEPVGEPLEPLTMAPILYPSM